MTTYSKIYIHIVFSVKYRKPMISPKWEQKLYKYITGIVQKRKHKMLAINGMPDHIHILIGFHPELSLSDLVRDIKKASNDYINQEIKPPYKFAWQIGYGAFSYSKSEIHRVIRYIQNQKKRHLKQSFENEYLTILKRFEIEFNDEFLFE